MIDMASKQFLPAFIKYTKTLADTVNAVKAAGVDASVQTETLKEVSALMAETKAALDNLVKTTADAAAKEEGITAKIIIGGAVITQEYADEIGADGYSKDAADAVKLAKSLM